MCADVTFPCRLKVKATTAVQPPHRAAAIRRIDPYLRQMGVDRGLLTEANAIPYQSVRFLRRDEIVRLGMERREFGETGWHVTDNAAPDYIESLFHTIWKGGVSLSNRVSDPGLWRCQTRAPDGGNRNDWGRNGGRDPSLSSAQGGAGFPDERSPDGQIRVAAELTSNRSYGQRPLRLAKRTTRCHPWQRGVGAPYTSGRGSCGRARRMSGERGTR
jgi:hypothetical protein